MPSVPLSYAPGMELHHPILSTLEVNGGQVKRESLDVKSAHFLIASFLWLLLWRFLCVRHINLEYLESNESDESDEEESDKLRSESGYVWYRFGWVVAWSIISCRCYACWRWWVIWWWWIVTGKLISISKVPWCGYCWKLTGLCCRRIWIVCIPQHTGSIRKVEWNNSHRKCTGLCCHRIFISLCIMWIPQFLFVL